MMIILTIVFSILLESQIWNFPVFVLTALLAWRFFSIGTYTTLKPYSQVLQQKSVSSKYAKKSGSKPPILLKASLLTIIAAPTMRSITVKTTKLRATWLSKSFRPTVVVEPRRSGFVCGTGSYAICLV